MDEKVKRITVDRYVKTRYQPPAGWRVMYSEYVVSRVSHHPQLAAVYPFTYRIHNEHDAVVAECRSGAVLRIERIATPAASDDGSAA